MRSPSEYLEQAAKYELRANQAKTENRRAEYTRLAQVYRYFAEEAAMLSLAPQEQSGRDAA